MYFWILERAGLVLFTMRRKVHMDPFSNQYETPIPGLLLSPHETS